MRFYSLEKLMNLHEGYKKSFKIDHYNLLLVQQSDELFLIESMCPHRGHPLTESDLQGTKLRCPLHNYQFDITSGDLIVSTEEHCRNLKTYDVIFQDKEVGLML